MNKAILKRTVALITYLDYLCKNETKSIYETEKTLLLIAKMKIELSRIEDNSVFIDTINNYENKLFSDLQRLNNC